MDRIQEIILRGLAQFGKKKTFAEILHSSGISLEDFKRLEIAATLEAEGYIQDVTYQLPLAIRARLTPSGEAFVRTLQGGAPPGNLLGLHHLLIFLQLNLAFV